jgi:tetratricopeptide (TPR) repeat protein
VKPEDERQLAVDLFNHAWKLLETDERTAEQDDELINAAHASRHHWAAVGTPANLARGEWQLARVYTVIGRSEPALYHARRCLAYCEANADALEDWDLPYAHEALARAHALAGEADEARRHAVQARELASRVADAEDREHLEEDLATLE